ncbi:hypothetical protein ABZ726_36940 [Streptomyces hundungensis]|uniref:hypothetical protein n=1 Tax=Streptomyces hundungensis TaxID=1077946 RepID=UPI0033E7503E
MQLAWDCGSEVLPTSPAFVFAFGTYLSIDFSPIDWQASGSFLNLAGASDGEAEACLPPEDDAEAEAESFFLSPPESEEQPAATSITGTAAQARTRASRMRGAGAWAFSGVAGADRCMIPSLFVLRAGRVIR